MESTSAISTSNIVNPINPLENTPDSSVVKTQDVKNESGTTEKTETKSDEFSSFLMKQLSRTSADQVNEEELFSAVIGQRLNKESAEAGNFYNEQVKSLTVSMARQDGYVPVEDVAKAALKATVDAGKITKEKAEIINASAFESAQIDNNLESLYDGRGETKAVATMEEMMFKIKSMMEDIDSGKKTVTARSLDIASNRGTTPGTLISLGLSSEVGKLAEGAELSSEGGSEKQIRFTWKHEASDGNLAVLLPQRLTNIDKVELFKDGELIEKGHYSKRTGDDRAVFRFDEPGKEYGRDVDVKISMDNGDTYTYNVRNGGERTYVPQDDYEEKKKS